MLMLTIIFMLRHVISAGVAVFKQETLFFEGCNYRFLDGGYPLCNQLLESGMSVSTTDCEMPNDTVCEFEFNGDPLVVLNYYISGKGEGRFLSEDQSVDLQLEKSGQVVASRVGSCEGRIAWSSCEPLRSVGVQIPAGFFDCFVRKNDQLVPSQLLLGNSGSCKAESAYYLGIMTSEMFSVVQQILQCPFTGIIREMFLQGKVLELLALQFDRFGNERTEISSGFTLRDEEIEKIMAAAEYLSKNLQEPPTIAELARIVYLNSTTLKKGFKIVFGTTVFSFLNQRRMDRAKSLLVNDGKNVNEVAGLVGYSNASHFSAAFRKIYGVNPGQFRFKRNRQ